MFQKIIGVAGALATVGIIVMVALSPRGEGFFPNLLSFREKSVPEPVREAVSPAAPLDAFSDSLTVVVPDSLPVPADDKSGAE